MGDTVPILRKDITRLFRLVTGVVTFLLLFIIICPIAIYTIPGDDEENNFFVFFINTSLTCLKVAPGRTVHFFFVL